jgi:hypothetical protein
MLEIKGEFKSSVQVPPKGPTIRPSREDPSMIVMKPEDILATNNMPESGKMNPTLPNVRK